MRNLYFLLFIIYFILFNECKCYSRRTNKLKPLQNYRYSDFKPRQYTNQLDDDLTQSQPQQLQDADLNNYNQHESGNNLNQDMDEDNDDEEVDGSNETVDEFIEYNDLNDYTDGNAEDDEEESENFNNNNDISVKKELTDYNYNYDTNDDPLEFDEPQNEQLNKIKRDVINSYADDLTQNIETMSDDEIGLALSNLSQNELETLYKLISAYDSGESEGKSKRETREDLSSNAFNEYDDNNNNIYNLHSKRCDDRKSKPNNKKNCIYRRYNNNRNNMYNRMKRSDEDDQQTKDADEGGANLSAAAPTAAVQNETKAAEPAVAPVAVAVAQAPPLPQQPPQPPPPVATSHTANATADAEHAAKSTSLINNVEPGNYFMDNGDTDNIRTVKRDAIIPFQKRYANPSSSLSTDRRIEAKIDYLRDKYKRQMLMKQMEGNNKRSYKNKARGINFNRPNIRKKRSNDAYENEYVNPMDDPQSPEHIKLLEESFPNPRSSNTLHQNNVPLVRVKRHDD